MYYPATYSKINICIHRYNKIYSYTEKHSGACTPDKEKLETALKELQEEYTETGDDKSTNKYLGVLRAKIAKTKKELVEASKKTKGKGFFVKKTGDATIALLGFPSTGKSSILNVLTNAGSKIAAYYFTTNNIIPGMLVYKNAHIQLLDMPGILENAHLGIGGGTSVIAQLRSADMVVFVVDIQDTSQINVLIKELNVLDIYPNKSKPHVQLQQSSQNTGIKIDLNKSSINAQSIRLVLNSFGVYNATVRIFQQMGEDELIANIAGKATYIPALVALNKADLQKNYEKIAAELSKRYQIEVIPVSATTNIGIDNLKKSMYNKLGLITVFLRPRLEKKGSPVTVKHGTNIRELAKKLHTEIFNELKCAYVDGPSTKHPNQRVGITHTLKDEDIITFIKNKS